MQSKVKLYLNLVILVSLLCCSDGLAMYQNLYIGPYYTSFNDTSEDPLWLSFPYFLEQPSDIDAYILFYHANSIRGHRSGSIIISEGELAVDQIPKMLYIKTPDGSVELERFDRVVAGFDATVAVFKNESTDFIEKDAAFAFKAPTRCFDLGKNIAIVHITVYNYTEVQFDKLLDTFKIYRLVES